MQVSSQRSSNSTTVVAIPGATGTTAPAPSFAGGYNLVQWTEAGFTFWAASGSTAHAAHGP